MSKSNETIVVIKMQLLEALYSNFIYRGPKKNHEVIIVHATIARP